MSMLTDPEMKDIVDQFCQESLQLCDTLEDSLDTLEDDPNNKEALEQFGQVIDRIMGAAKSLGAEHTGKLCQLGKTIGYKSSQAEVDQAMGEIIVAVLFDLVDLVKKLVTIIQKGNGEQTDSINIDAFSSRLKWLSEKFIHIERTSCSYDEEEENDQETIDDLLADLGL